MNSALSSQFKTILDLQTLLSKMYLRNVLMSVKKATYGRVLSAPCFLIKLYTLYLGILFKEKKNTEGCHTK